MKKWCHDWVRLHGHIMIMLEDRHKRNPQGLAEDTQNVHGRLARHTTSRSTVGLIICQQKSLHTVEHEIKYKTSLLVLGIGQLVRIWGGCRHQTSETLCRVKTAVDYPK